MPFTFDLSRLRLDGVVTIVVSPIQPDQDTTQYVRLIQLYTESTADNPNRRPIIEIACYGGDQTISNPTALEIAIPGGIEF